MFDDDEDSHPPTRMQIREALRTAAHSTSGAEERWQALRDIGADDATLKIQLAIEFGSFGGCSSPIWHQHHGGQRPTLIVGWSPNDVTITGCELLKMARAVLEIPTPAMAKQRSLF